MWASLLHSRAFSRKDDIQLAVLFPLSGSASGAAWFGRRVASA